MSSRRTSFSFLVLVGALLLALVPELGAGATRISAATPSNFKIAVNGKTLTAAQLVKTAETYVSTRPGRTQVSVRWANDLRGSGYYVLINNSRKNATRTCTAGTSCSATASTALVKGDEVSWSIQIRRTAGNKLVTEKVVCLLGKA
jgi:hypothetical protein